jgi:hypothetical protein
MDEDERLKPVLLNVEKQYTGKDYGDNTNITGKVKASEVNAVIDLFPAMTIQQTRNISPISCLPLALTTFPTLYE